MCSMLRQQILCAILVVLVQWVRPTMPAVEVDCGNTLIMGQFMCPDPSINHIDPHTQQPHGCTKDNVATVWCVAADGIICSETKNSTFMGQIPCQWT